MSLQDREVRWYRGMSAQIRVGKVRPEVRNYCEEKA